MEQAQLATDIERLAGNLGQLPPPVSRPVLVVISGLPGTGKSYFSHKLAERTPLAVLESDSLRKLLFTPPSYSSKESSQLFQTVHHLIEDLLRKGISLILDATNLAEQHREYLYGIADRLDVGLVLVCVDAPPRVVRERLRNRRVNPENSSDADWAVYLKMRPTAQRINRRHYYVDTSEDINPLLDEIVREVYSQVR